MNKKVIAIKLIIFLLILMIVVLISDMEYNRKPYVKSYNFSDKYNEDKSLKVSSGFCSPFKIK